MNNQINCPCGKVFQYHYLLLRHQESIRGCSYTKSLRETTEQQCICNNCHKKLSNSYSLSRHNKICKATKSIPDNPKHLDTNMDILDTMIEKINKLKINKNLDINISLITQLDNILNSISSDTQTINQNPIIFKPNTNIDIEKLININNTTNNTNNTNCNNTTNITNNNSPTIHPIIYPFGYENLSFLSNREMLNIITSRCIKLDIS